LGTPEEKAVFDSLEPLAAAFQHAHKEFYRLKFITYVLLADCNDMDEDASYRTYCGPHKDAPSVPMLLETFAHLCLS
jgi:hypothetical protein